MNNHRPIQVITDIIDASWNEMFAVMHGVAMAMSPDPITIAPVTPVEEFSITQGAFLTRLLAKSFTSPVVIFTNVSPHEKYNTDVIGKTKDRDIIFVGANTGVFDWLVRDFGLEYLVHINVKKPFVVDGQLAYLPGEDPPKNYDSQFRTKAIYSTFTAHTILGPIAVGLALGVDRRKFGEDRGRDFIVPLEISDGEVVHIDNYGNAKISGPFQFAPETEIELYVNGKTTANCRFINGRMMSRPTNSYVAYPSTSLQNMADLALVRGNASRQLGLKIGDIVTFRIKEQTVVELG